jgi:hypothetical protein
VFLAVSENVSLLGSSVNRGNSPLDSFVSCCHGRSKEKEAAVDQRRVNPWTWQDNFGFSRQAMRRIIPSCLEPLAIAILTGKRDVS